MLFGAQIGRRSAAVMSSIPVAPSFHVRRYAYSIRSMSIRKCSDVKTCSGCTLACSATIRLPAVGGTVSRQGTDRETAPGRTAENVLSRMAVARWEWCWQ